MIPLRDENPTRRVPWVTLALIAANVAVFVYNLGLDDRALAAFWARWAVIPARLLADPFSASQIATVFSAMFMHAGWVHIIGNMLYLWIFGNNVEDRFGPLGFLGFYLASGVAATAAQVFAMPASTIPNLGASGAVAGVLAAYLLLFPGAAIVTLIPILFFIEIARVPAFIVIGFWFLLQLGNGFASLGAGMAGSGVAYWAHVGGFIAGLALAAPAAIMQWGSRRRRRSY